MARETKTKHIPFPEKVPTAKGDVESVTMRAPLVGDMLAAQVAAAEACADQERQPTSAETEVRLFARLCGLIPEDIQDWPYWAYTDLQEAFRFLSARPEARADAPAETEEAPAD